MNRPFAVVVADRGGHWDEWLVGASDKDEAVGFVRAHFGLAGRKITAYDMSVESELVKTSGIYGIPKVVDHGRPHFLPVPAMSGLEGQLKRQMVRPAVEGSRSTATSPVAKKRKTRGRTIGARTMNRTPQLREVVPAVVVKAPPPPPPAVEEVEAVPEPTPVQEPAKMKAAAKHAAKKVKETPPDPTVGLGGGIGLDIIEITACKTVLPE